MRYIALTTALIVTMQFATMAAEDNDIIEQQDFADGIESAYWESGNINNLEHDAELGGVTLKKDSNGERISAVGNMYSEFDEVVDSTGGVDFELEFNLGTEGKSVRSASIIVYTTEEVIHAKFICYRSDSVWQVFLVYGRNATVTVSPISALYEDFIYDDTTIYKMKLHIAGNTANVSIDDSTPVSFGASPTSSTLTGVAISLEDGHKSNTAKLESFSASYTTE